MALEYIADGICVYSIQVSEPDAQEIRKMLDPENVIGMGCRVIKRPDCCVLCRMNEDCSRIPLHVRCHCTIEPYLDIGEETPA